MAERTTLGEVLERTVGDCIDHPHEQAGHCVYCKTCGTRLYHGRCWSEEEREVAREVMGRKPPEAADG